MEDVSNSWNTEADRITGIDKYKCLGALCSSLGPSAAGHRGSGAKRLSEFKPTAKDLGRGSIVVLPVPVLLPF